MADDSQRILGGDEMDMENSLSQNRLIKLHQKNLGSQLVGRETSMSSLHRSNQAIRTEPRPAETHTNLVNIRRRNSQATQLTDVEKASIGRITTNEADDNVLVTFSTYQRYIMNYFGGWKFIILSNLAIIGFT